MRVLHITDLHLLADPAARLHGWQVAASFERVLEHALAHAGEIDVLVLGGDLVDDESAAGYRWLDQRLAAFDRPVLAIAGNHDDPALMQQLLPHAHVHRPLAVSGWQLYGLDSHRAGQAGGRIGRRALAELDAALTASAQPSLICVHHPPRALGSVWLDAIGLDDGPELMALLRRHRHVAGVLCGHAHQAQAWPDSRPAVWITPSTMRQFLPGATTFAQDSDQSPGYRIIDLTAHQQPASRVIRVPEAAKACG